MSENWKLLGLANYLRNRSEDGGDINLSREECRLIADALSSPPPEAATKTRCKHGVWKGDHCWKCGGEGLTIKTFDGEEPAIPVAASWIKHIYNCLPNLGPDYACEQCVPGAKGVVQGFKCYYHMAVDAEAEPLPQRGSE